MIEIVLRPFSREQRGPKAPYASRQMFAGHWNAQ